MVVKLTLVVEAIPTTRSTRILCECVYMFNDMEGMSQSVTKVFINVC